MKKVTDQEKNYVRMALDWYSGRVQGVKPDQAKEEILLVGDDKEKRNLIKMFLGSVVLVQLDAQTQEIKDYLK